MDDWIVIWLGFFSDSAMGSITTMNICFHSRFPLSGLDGSTRCRRRAFMIEMSFF